MSGPVTSKLGDIAQIKQGKYLAKEEMSLERTPAFNIPVHGANGIIGWTNEPMYRHGCALLTCRGSNSGMVLWADGPLWVSNNAMAILPHSGIQRYCFYNLLENPAYDMVSGSAQPQITRRDLELKLVLWHEPSEQREIAGILGALDDKIEVNRKASALLEEMARALYRSWFVTYDPVTAAADGRPPAHLPPETAALFPATFQDNGLPEGWNLRPLAQVCETVKETVKPMEAPEAAFWHFSLPAFDAGALPILERGAEIKSNKGFVPNDAILFSRLNPAIPRVWWARCDQAQGTPAASTEFFMAKAQRSAETPWLYSLMSSAEFQEQARSRVTGTSNSHQRVNPAALTAIEVIDPGPQVREAFGAMSGSWFERIHAMKAQSQTLAALRDSLLPRLMSGELRVGAARELVEEVA